jgi:hypothetical protein
MFNEINNNIYHTILIDTTLNEVIIEPIEKYSCSYFYHIFCCCFTTTNNDNDNNVYLYV